MLITLFSDASMCEKQLVGGWAAWLKSGRSYDAHRVGAPFAVRVNDTAMAESMAVVNALRTGIRDGFIHPDDTVLVQTDNDSVMSVLTGEARRRMSKTVRLRKGLSRSQAKAIVRERNAEIAAVSDAFRSCVERYGLEIRWRHVKGHRGNVDRRSAVNTYCDKMAKQHMRSARGRAVPTIAEASAARAARMNAPVMVSGAAQAA